MLEWGEQLMHVQCAFVESVARSTCMLPFCAIIGECAVLFACNALASEP